MNRVQLPALLRDLQGGRGKLQKLRSRPYFVHVAPLCPPTLIDQFLKLKQEQEKEVQSECSILWGEG